MPTPRNSNAGHTMRFGIDLQPPDVLFEARELGAAEALARALAIMEAGRPSWHADAACRESDIDFTSGAKADRAAAHQVCGGGCLVRPDCLAWALEIGDTVAVLGCMDPAARRQYAKRIKEEATSAETDRHTRRPSRSARRRAHREAARRAASGRPDVRRRR